MIEDRVVLKNAVGLHARAASAFVREASRFDSEITVSKGEESYDAKSIMSVLSLGAYKGDEVILRVHGEDEEEAMAALLDLLKYRVLDVK